MWLRAVRKGLISRAVASLLALVVCGGALDWGHVGGDDRDCDIIVTHHDHNAHRISGAPLPTPTEDHCYICHSLRLLHQALASRYERVALAGASVRPLDGHVLAVRDGLRVGIASRAPPSARL